MSGPNPIPEGTIKPPPPPAPPEPEDCSEPIAQDIDQHFLDMFTAEVDKHQSKLQKRNINLLRAVIQLMPYAEKVAVQVLKLGTTDELTEVRKVLRRAEILIIGETW